MRSLKFEDIQEGDIIRIEHGFTFKHYHFCLVKGLNKDRTRKLLDSRGQDYSEPLENIWNMPVLRRTITIVGNIRSYDKMWKEIVAHGLETFMAK